MLLAATVVFGERLDDMALRDSMMVKGSLRGHRWLEKNGLESYLLRQSWRPTEDSGLRCVGRWSYGPSLKVSLQVTPGDTIICLTRGSGATLARFRSQDSVTFDLLGDLNFAGIPRRAIITDTIVVAGIHVGGTGLEVHGISNPAQPNLLSRVDLPVVNDIAVKDSFVYAACEDDTLRIYNIADPRQPVRVGACRDSCDLFMTQAGNYCYLVHVSGVNIVDVSNPASPHRVGRIGGEPLAVYVRDTLCYDMIFGEGLRIYNVKNPASPQEVGWLTLGDAMDLTMPSTEDTLLFTSLLDVVNVSNPASPSLVGHIDIPAEYEYGVAVVPAVNYALVANYTDGVVAVDVTNPANPTFDTTAFGAGSVLDIYVDGTKAYLASPLNGMTILDVSDPTRPSRLGGVDIVGLNPACMSVAARDSFAYMHWYQRPQFQSVDVSDPARPQRVAGVDVTNPPEDMVIRDSFVYIAEINKLQIVNVARPREPVLVGNCATQGDAYGLCVVDTLAYAANYPFAIIDVKQPSNPSIVGTIQRGAWNGTVRDTFLFLSSGGILVYSIARPDQPRLLDSLSVGTNTYWVEAVGTLLYAANRDGVRVIDASDVHNMRVRGFCTAPRTVNRLAYMSPHIYAACWEAGVSIYESTQVALSEPTKGGDVHAEPSVRPNPVTTSASISIYGKWPATVTVRDIAGRLMPCVVKNRGRGEVVLDIAVIPPGVYFVQSGTGATSARVKFVRQ